MRFTAAVLVTLALGNVFTPAARADDTKPTPGSKLSPEQREKVKDRLAKLTPGQPTDLTVQPVGAEARIDGGQVREDGVDDGRRD